MPNFKVASRTADELAKHKAELDEMFLPIKGKDGKLDPRGVEKINAGRFEISELIVQLIQDTISYTDPTPFFVDTTTGDLRNQYIWQEMHADSALRVVNRAYGTKPLSQRLFFKEFGMTTSHKEINVEIPLEEVNSGRITPSMVVEAMAEAINRYRVSMIMDAIDAGVPADDDQTGEAGYTLRYSGLTAANLDKAIDGLWDDAETPTIFGRHIPLAPTIRAFAGWSEDIKTELQLRGMIGTYRGAPIVTLQDKYSRKLDGHSLRRDRVYLTGATKGAVYMSKDVSFLNYSMVDARTSSFATGIRLEDGVMVWRPYSYRIIEV